MSNYLEKDISKALSHIKATLKGFKGYEKATDWDKGAFTINDVVHLMLTFNNNDTVGGSVIPPKL